MIIANAYPTKENPQLGIFEFDQAKALQQAGNRVVLVSLDLRSIRRKRRLGKYHIKKDGIDIYNISVPMGAIPYKFFYFFGKLALQSIIKVAIKEVGRPDIIHSHFTDMSAIAGSLKKKYSIPLVVTEHSSLMNSSEISSGSMFFANKAYRNADKLICVSSALKNNILRFFKLKPVVIPNIVDTESIQYNPTKHDKFTFVSVGNLLQSKGFNVLFAAFKQMRNTDSLLYIIGDGVEREKLEKQIVEYGLERRIILLGRKNRKEISEILNRSDVFVLASRTETFGVVYAEAMLAGLPVIATKCGGPEDFVDETNGKLVDVGDVNALSQEMDNMYETRGKYDGKEISKNCREKFSPEEIAKQLMDVYNVL